MKLTQYLYQIGTLVVVWLIIPIFLVWIGLNQIRPLFEGDFTRHLGSIEVSYIQMAAFIKSSLPGFAWQPRWYLGYPLSVIYTPLVPFVEHWLHEGLGWSYGHGYRVITAVAYIGTLVTLFLLGRTLFKNTASGLIAALCYGILPSIIALLYPEVAQDRFALNLIEPRRFTILVRWGEGPHIVSLLFLPLAASCLVSYLRQGKKRFLVGGALMSALVALTNSVGTWGYLLMVGAIVLGELVEQRVNWQMIVKKVIWFGLLSYGLIAFWFNKLFLATFFQEGGGALSYWRDAFPWGWLGIGFILIIYCLVSVKLLSKVQGLTSALLYFLIMFWLVNTYYASGTEKIELVPQVLRLNTEVDLALSLFLGGILAVLGTIIKRKGQLAYSLSTGFALGLILIPLLLRQLQLVNEIPTHARSAQAEGIDLTKTAEYEIAQKLTALVKNDERVFVPGNYAFYLNYFTDVPQIRGALFQSAVHPWAEHIYYQVTNGKDADISVAWLKIANVGWLVYSNNETRELFRDFRYVDSGKFDQTLKLTQELTGGDKIYQVPLQEISLVKAVPETIIQVKKPVNAIDAEPIFQYVDYLEASNNQLNITRIKNGEYSIEGEADEGELILVQMAYTNGWQAKDKLNRPLRVTADPLGFILIKPNQVGLQNLTLVYHQPLSIWLGKIITVLTIITIIYFLLKPEKKI